MDQAERSRLVFLLDALRAAPGRSKELIALVERAGSSRRYQQALESLRKSDNVARASADLRESLR